MLLDQLVLLCLLIPARHALSVSQPYRVVGTHGTVNLFCSLHHPSLPQLQPQPDHKPLAQPQPPSYPGPRDLRLTLLKGLHGRQEVCSSSFHSSQSELKVNPRGEVACAAQLTQARVGLTVSGLRGNDTDLYRCVFEILYPPPYLRVTGNGTLVHVIDQPEECSGAAPPEAQRQTAEAGVTQSAVSLSVWVLATTSALILLGILTYQTSGWIQRRRDQRGAPIP